MFSQKWETIPIRICFSRASSKLVQTNTVLFCTVILSSYAIKKVYWNDIECAELIALSYRSNRWIPRRYGNQSLRVFAVHERLVVHDAVVIVRQWKRQTRPRFDYFKVEQYFRPLDYVLILHLHVLVPIWTRMLVQKSQSMHQLVENCSFVVETPRAKVELLERKCPGRYETVLSKQAIAYRNSQRSPSISPATTGLGCYTNVAYFVGSFFETNARIWIHAVHGTLDCENFITGCEYVI